MVTKIAILTPVCSRNQTYTHIEDTPLTKILIPSLKMDSKTNRQFYFTVFVGVDNNDEFYMQNIDYFTNNGMFAIILKDCNHKPARAWNQLLKVAYDEGYEYFFQVGDDVNILSPKWCEIFISKLKETNNIGIVGPHDPMNVIWRKENKLDLVIEQAFFHRKHYEIFQTLFHPLIDNIYCDDWLTHVYLSINKCFVSISAEIKYQNLMRNRRYDFKVVSELGEYVKEGVLTYQNYFKNKNSKNVISFSLWGQNLKYTIGALRNAELAQVIYPGWVCRFYIGSSVDTSIIKKLQEMNNTEVILMSEQGNWTSMFWRFFAASDEDINYVIFRDTDSRIHFREQSAVEDWINSGLSFHIMRDHPYHGYKIMGGMWGVKGNHIKHFKSLIEEDNVTDYYQTDQDFLKNKIYDSTVGDCMIHDEFFDFEPNRNSFKVPPNNYHFVGESFDENENVNEEHSAIFKHVLDQRMQLCIEENHKVEIKIALCCIALNEIKYISEFIRYNLCLGFSTIFIYDNSPENELNFLESDSVVVIHFPGAQRQLGAYNDFIYTKSSEFDYVAFFDCDEFLVLNSVTLSDLCLRYVKDGALGVNWYFFGNNNKETYDNKPVLERFTKRQMSLDLHIKTIANCKYIYNGGMNHVHCPTEKTKFRDTSGNLIDGPYSNSKDDSVCQLNHYFCKSNDEFRKKCARGRADLDVARIFVDYLDELNHNDVEDLRALTFIKSVPVDIHVQYGLSELNYFLKQKQPNVSVNLSMLNNVLQNKNIKSVLQLAFDPHLTVTFIENNIDFIFAFRSGPEKDYIYKKYPNSYLRLNEDDGSTFNEPVQFDLIISNQNCLNYDKFCHKDTLVLQECECIKK